MRLVLIGAIVATFVVGIGVVVSMKTDRVVGWCRWKSVDEAEYSAGNRAILDELPIYPGATRTNSYSFGQRASDACLPGENGPPFGGYTTDDTYTLPSKGRNVVSAPWKVWDKFGNTRVPARVPSVLVYYDQKLRQDGWQRNGWSGYEIYFKRGSAILAASVSLNADDPYKREPYHQLRVDHGLFS